MRVIIFGATGMVGQGVLRECVRDARVERILCVTRGALTVSDPKIQEVRHEDFTDFAPLREQFAGYDACFFCLGVSSLGMREPEYTRITRDYTIASADAMPERSPKFVFVYVSGAGADSSESSRTMWERVRGRVENELLALTSVRAYVVRPAFIQPRGGVASKTTLYRLAYRATGFLYPALVRLFPQAVTDSESIGRAMLALASGRGHDERVLNCQQINLIAGPGA